MLMGHFSYSKTTWIRNILSLHWSCPSDWQDSEICNFFKMIAKMFSDSTMHSFRSCKVWHASFQFDMSNLSNFIAISASISFHAMFSLLFNNEHNEERMTGRKKRNIFSFYWGLLINQTSNFEKKKFDAGKPLWGGGFRAVHFLFHFLLSIYMCVCVYFLYISFVI